MSEMIAGSRREQRRAQELAGRRADLLDAALEVFAEKGFDGAQISEIAGLAEVSLASLYAMFRFYEALETGD
jgi:TetR/AcrR family transcriptional repressor of mexJK operon